MRRLGLLLARMRAHGPTPDESGATAPRRPAPPRSSGLCSTALRYSTLGIPIKYVVSRLVVVCALSHRTRCDVWCIRFCGLAAARGEKDTAMRYDLGLQRYGLYFTQGRDLSSYFLLYLLYGTISHRTSSSTSAHPRVHVEGSAARRMVASEPRVTLAPLHRAGAALRETESESVLLLAHVLVRCRVLRRLALLGCRPNMLKHAPFVSHGSTSTCQPLTGTYPRSPSNRPFPTSRSICR